MKMMKHFKWPALSFNESKDTYETVHLWTQVIGKIKLAKMPWINHAWHVTLLVTPTGLTTGSIPDAFQTFQIDFDFIHDKLVIVTEEGSRREFALKNISVAGFYTKVLNALDELGISVRIIPVPNEIERVIRFDEDELHSTYRSDQMHALHKAFLNAQNVFTQFRSEFNGKCSPVHLFWGGLDLAVSRFSGRKAPLHPGGIPNLPDWVAQEAYSHEVCSCGFWPGSDAVPFAAFYSYIYPEPKGYDKFKVEPADAYYHPVLKENILPYDKVRESSDPEGSLLLFLRSSYNAAAELANWDKNLAEIRTTGSL